MKNKVIFITVASILFTLITANCAIAQFAGGGPNRYDIYSDDFNAYTLDPIWTLVDPTGDVMVLMQGAGTGDAQLLFSVPAGESHDAWNLNTAPVLLQPANNADFAVQVKFDSLVEGRYQSQGIIIQEDSDNWLRFDFYSNGEGMRIFAAITVNGSSSSMIDRSITPGVPIYMRVERAGDYWTQSYSYDGVNWTVAVSFTHQIVVTKVGPFVGNFEVGYNAPAHTAIIDYFFNLASPIVPEDGGPVPETEQELILTVTGLGGTVTVDPELPIYGCGDVLQLTATPDTGYRVLSWSGTDNDTLTTNTNTVTMDSDKNVTVQFELIPAQYDLTAFEYGVIDPNAMGRTAIGDINGDGYNDVVVHTWGANRGQVSDGQLVWYRYPGWTKLVIRQDVNFFGDGIVIADLDGDGDNDVVTSRGNDKSAQVWWYENLGDSTTFSWAEHNIGTVETNSEVKDIEVHDMDNDGKPDIVVRTKHKVAIYFQDNTDSWVAKMINTREREGMALGDLDGDGDYDIVLNGLWLENPPNTRNHHKWSEYTIDDQWYADNTGEWQDYSVMVVVKDINGDGKADVVFSHSEKPGFKVTWYESDNPRGGKRAWTKHEIAVVDYCHTLCAFDMDLDGDIDIMAATLKRTSNPKVLLFMNDKGDGLHWTIVEVDNKSAYKGQTGDIDNDGDIDIVSAMSWENSPIQLWRNTTNRASTSRLDRWERHLVDGAMPDNAVFIEAGDVDGDKLIDLVAGAWWWKNPGSLDSTWTRHTIGRPLNNMAVLHDFDCDGDLDIFGTQGNGAGSNHNFAWARNDGFGNFNILTNISTGGSGDFLQGRLMDNFGSGEQIVLSWHNGGGGLQALEIPIDPSKTKWTFSTLCPDTMKEDLSKGDIDRDGDIDILLGTKWMRNEGQTWTAFILGRFTDLDSDAEPDRNDLVDINGDGRLDAVIAMENGTQILWFEAPSDPTTSWTRHIIGTVDGQGFSMDVADFNGDGYPDVVVGEHRGLTNNRVILFENMRKGSQWTRYEIDTDSKETIDHHVGTQAVDIDGDGDLDIISIGWYNKKVWIYENKGD